MTPTIGTVPAPSPGVSPTIVGLLRGLAYATLAAIASAAVAFTGGVDADSLGKNAWVIPVALAGARALEGYIDKVRGQAPQVPTGSKPADPEAYVPTATAVLEVAPPPATTVPERSIEDRNADILDAVKASMPRAADATVNRVTDAVIAALG